MSIPPTNSDEPLVDFLCRIGEEVDRNILTSQLLMRSTVDLDQFKDQRGEFKKWLHIFHVANRPTFKNTYFKTTTVLPWCTDQQTVDLEFHRAVVALGGYVNYPLSWRSFSWQIPPLLSSPVYGVFASNPSQNAFHESIKLVAGTYPFNVEFDTLQGLRFFGALQPAVLVPRSDGKMLPLLSTNKAEYDNANSGLGEACAESLRER